MNENFYDGGVGIYNCTKLSHVILLLGLLNDVYKMYYMVYLKMLTKQLNANVAPKMTFISNNILLYFAKTFVQGSFS